MELRRSYDPLWGLSWTGVISTGQRRSERVFGGGCFRHATLRGPLGLTGPLGWVCCVESPADCVQVFCGWMAAWLSLPARGRALAMRGVAAPAHAQAHALCERWEKMPGGWRAYDALHGCGCDLPLLFKFVTHRRTMIFTPCGMILPDVTIW